MVLAALYEQVSWVCNYLRCIHSDYRPETDDYAYSTFTLQFVCDTRSGLLSFVGRYICYYIFHLLGEQQWAYII